MIILFLGGGVDAFFEKSSTFFHTPVFAWFWCKLFHFFAKMPRVYVGNLPVDIRESELEDLFYKYGRIREIDIKRPPRPPAFAFISYDDIRGKFCNLIA